jgi:hypothetical protein
MMNILSHKPGRRVLLMFAVGFAAVALISCAPESPPSENSSETPEAEASQGAVAKGADQVNKAIAGAADAVTSFTYSQREDFRNWVKTRLDEIEVKLEEIDGEIAELDDTSAEARSTTQRELETTAQQIQEQLDAAMNASADAWVETSAKVTVALNDFSKKVSDFLRDVSQQ